MDYIEYFEGIRDHQLSDITIVIAGDGLYNSANMIDVLRKHQAQVIWLDETLKLTETASYVLKEETQKAIKGIIDAFGGIDVLITNFHTDNDSVLDTDHTAICSTWNTRLEMIYTLCEEVAQNMMATRKGKIINTTSFLGKRSYLGAVPLMTSLSSAIIGMTKAFAEKLAPYQVTANCLTIGMIDAEKSIAGKTFEEIEGRLPFQWLPLQHFGNVTDVANALAFLSSPFSDYITGYSMDINGGFVMD